MPSTLNKVAVISGVWPPHRSGEAEYALHLSRQLAAEGMDVHVLTGTKVPGEEQGRISTRPAQRLTVHPIMPGWSWRDWPRVRRFLKAGRFDAVYVVYVGWIYQRKPMITFLPTLARRVLRGAPVVSILMSVSGADPASQSLMSRAVHRLVRAWSGRSANYHLGTLAGSDGLACLGDDHRERLGRIDPEAAGRCQAIPPGPPIHVAKHSRKMRGAGDAGVDAARRHLGASSGGDFLLAYFGLIYPVKGLGTLIQAFARVAAVRPGARLAIIGGTIADEDGKNDRYLHELKVMARELGVADRIVWTGAFDSHTDQASKWLWACDAAVLPWDVGMRLNNSSLAVVAAHELPLVATRPTASEKSLVYEGNVLFCPPKDPEALADAMLRVVDDETLRARLSSGIAELSKNHLTWPVVVERLLQLTHDAKDRKGRRGESSDPTGESRRPRFRHLADRVLFHSLAWCLRRRLPRSLRWRLHARVRALMGRIGPLTGDMVVRTVHGFRFHAQRDERLGRHVYATGDYEPATARRIAASLRPGDVMVDVGANAGFFSLLAARCVGGKGRVHAFEPSPTTRQWLGQNIAINRAANVIIPHAQALSDKAGTLELHQGPVDHSGVTSLRPIQGASAVHQVPVARLDDLLAPSRPVRLIKIDVEGAELLALRGMTRTLTAHHPDLIIEVTDEFLRFMGGSAVELREMLAGMGYAGYVLDHEGLRPWPAGLGEVPAEFPPQFNAFFTVEAAEGRLSIEAERARRAA
ncbi:MAG: FkbM family methyltransferase [Phycisphaeraceae bacterium]|nr:FkbM family methyltransferase [Phycisphaeraceae bacterium]